MPMTFGCQWRLLSYSSNDAYTNMAIDEAILEAHLAGLVPPTLRLYGFEPNALSIGRTQVLPAQLKNKAAERGIAVVRRPTGGRAVLHQGDITYSFVGASVHANDPDLNYPSCDVICDELAVPGRKITGFLSGSVLGAYKQICQGIIKAFSPLGVKLQLGSAQASYKHVHDCFLATTSSDLHVEGKKIVGSAQLRRKGGVLQHGSILLNQEQLAMADLLLNEDTASKGLTRHANLFELIARTLSFSELEHLMKLGFEEAFAVILTAGELTVFELTLAAKLRIRYFV